MIIENQHHAIYDFHWKKYFINLCFFPIHEKSNISDSRKYCFILIYFSLFTIAACAAANRAIGTLNGLQET